MGFFSNKAAQEPSFSRAWLAKHGPISRKNELAFGIANRIAASPIGAAEAWGKPLDDATLETGRSVARDALAQDYSLAGRVARDSALLFESYGGLALYRTTSLESVGLDDSITTADGSPNATAVEKAAAESLAVARTLQARSQGGEATSHDLAIYTQLHEDKSASGYERALSLTAWPCIVVARMVTSGHLSTENTSLFDGGLSSIGRMEAAGWYPNPINAGDTSTGEAQFERWWDGSDWTDRLRVRDGRRWDERQATIFLTPQN